MKRIHHNLESVENASGLKWYVGLYLGLARVFMNIVKKKVTAHENVKAVLIPTISAKDPITKKEILINVMDRYFFVGASKEIKSEQDIGLKDTYGTIILLRDENHRLSKITIKDIEKVINSQVKKNIQENVRITVTAGTFKDWDGVVERKHKDNLVVRFVVDNYGYSTEISPILCKL
jgi:transcription antitermination factor NusG